MTLGEIALWREINNKKLGVRFSRQIPIDNFIIDFYCKDAFDFNFNYYDLCLIDPPYLNTDATYCRKWRDELDIELINKINAECNKFVYFGQSVSNGVENKNIVDFAKRHNCKVLKNTTANCSANKTSKKETVEVMIYNF